MKTATILLVAVTVFTGLLQQSAAAPAESGWGLLEQTIEKVDALSEKVIDGVKKTIHKLTNGDEKDIKNQIEELVKLVKKDIKTSDEALAIIVKAVKEALTKGDQKEGLTKVENWLDGFEDVVATIHKKLLKAVTIGTKEALESILALLSKAIENTEAESATVIKNLEGVLKALFEEKLNFILNNARTVHEAIINVLAGKGVDASAINAGENIENIIEELEKLVKTDIKTSDAALTIIVKAVKEALTKVTGDKKENLTKVTDWLDGFVDVVATIHKKLLDAVIIGTKEALESILALLSKAIEDTEAESATVIKNLEGDLKSLFEEKLNLILNNARTVHEAIKKVVTAQ